MTVLIPDRLGIFVEQLGLDVPSSAISLLFWGWDHDNSGALSMKELATVLNDKSILKPLSSVDLDEGPDAPPIPEQLKIALAINAVKILSLFNQWDEDGNGLINVFEFETGLRAVSDANRSNPELLNSCLTLSMQSASCSWVST